MIDDNLSEIATFIAGGGYPGLISTQYLQLFDGVIRKFWGRDYFLFRQDSLRYVLLYDGDLVLSGTSLTGSAKVCTYYAGTSNSSAFYQFSGVEAVNLNVSGLVAYSNLGDYPVLGGVTRESSALPWFIFIAFLVAFVASFFRR